MSNLTELLRLLHKWKKAGIVEPKLRDMWEEEVFITRTANLCKAMPSKLPCKAFKFDSKDWRQMYRLQKKVTK